MYRVLNVIILVGFVATLACAPASRQQATKKDVATTNTKAAQPPAGNDGTPPAAATQTDPAADPSQKVNNKVEKAVSNSGGSDEDQSGGSGSDTVSASTGKLTISIVKIRDIIQDKSKQGSMNLMLEGQSADGKAIRASVAVDPKGKATDDQLTSDATFNCKTNKSASPYDCTESELTFTMQGIPFVASVTKVSDIQVTELFAIPSGKDSPTDYKIDPTYTNADFGKGEFRKVILTYGTKKIVGLRGTIIAKGYGSIGSKGADDIQLSKDFNIAIRVFGLPSTDTKKLGIKALGITKKDNKSLTRQDEQLPMLVNDSVFRYSIVVSTVNPKASDPATELLVLMLKTPGASDTEDADTADANVDGSSSDDRQDSPEAPPAPKKKHKVVSAAPSSALAFKQGSETPLLDRYTSGNSVVSTPNLDRILSGSSTQN